MPKPLQYLHSPPREKPWRTLGRLWRTLEDRAIPTIGGQDEQQRPHVYMLTTAASVYYQNMTRHEPMPVLVGWRPQCTFINIEAWKFQPITS